MDARCGRRSKLTVSRSNFWSPRYTDEDDDGAVRIYNQANSKLELQVSSTFLSDLLDDMEYFAETKTARVFCRSDSVGTPINLRVQRQNEADVGYTFDRNQPLKKILVDYCRQKGLTYDTMRFLFDGKQVWPEKTAADLEMEDEDTIDVFTGQIGG